MAIKIRNKRKTEFSMASMSDIVFLLLIFFMLTSTLVAPNAIKLLLPQSNNRTTEPPPKFIISINENMDYFLQGIQVDEDVLVLRIAPEEPVTWHILHCSSENSWGLLVLMHKPITAAKIATAGTR